jgi:hypothetical protein
MFLLTYHYEDRLLANNAELGHRVNDAQKRIHRLGLLANHSLVNRQGQTMVVKVRLHLLAVDVEDIQVHDSKAATPPLIAAGKLGVFGVEDPIKEREIILDLLVSFDMEAVLRLDNGCFEV